MFIFEYTAPKTKRIETEDLASRTGKIEAAGGFDNVSFTEKKFTKNDLDNFKDYNVATIDFELANETPNIEFRTFTSGHSNLYIDYFELEKIE